VLCCIGSNGLERQVIQLPNESDDEFEEPFDKLKKNSNSNASTKKNSNSNDNDDDDDITANATTAATTNGNAKGKGKGKAKALSKQTSTSEVQEEAVHETPKQQQAYRPCNHTGHCVPHQHTDECLPGCIGDVDGCCSCSNSDHYCTIYCKCPLNCPKRFRGCNCGSGQCRTKVCFTICVCILLLHVYTTVAFKMLDHVL
jgi:hypothetical protein